jgi:hemoglobin
MNTRKVVTALLLAGLGVGFSTVVLGAGNAAAGAQKASFCLACHGADGNSPWVSSRLAGQHPQALTDTMRAYKAGKRFAHPMMSIVTLGLTDQDVADLVAFYASQRPVSMDKASLYWRLGGKEAITAAVDQTIALSKADPRLAGRLSGACRDKLIDQLCSATGGPCTYTGRDMKSAHAGLGITAAEFGAVAENLSKVLDKFQVAPKEKNELLGMLAPMQADIVKP